eukprot:m.65704 g.65704  ORF g.65704 m.65704 type:complete len:126 (-) comp15928_c0_seq2:1805-2182(-)
MGHSGGVRTSSACALNLATSVSRAMCFMMYLSQLRPHLLGERFEPATLPTVYPPVGFTSRHGTHVVVVDVIYSEQNAMTTTCVSATESDPSDVCFERWWAGFLNIGLHEVCVNQGSHSLRRWRHW